MKAAVIVHGPVVRAVLTGAVLQRGKLTQARVRLHRALEEHRRCPCHHAEIEVHLAVRALDRLIHLPPGLRKTPAPGGKSETRGSGGHEALSKIAGGCDAGNSPVLVEGAVAHPSWSRDGD